VTRIQIDWQVAPEGLDDAGVEAAALAAVAEGDRQVAELSIALVDDPTLAELHERYLDDPTVTDVMSFDVTPGPESAPLVGEVVVSVDRAREVSARRGVRLDYEIALYVVHGTLHLCGFDDIDAEDRSAMRAAERRALTALGYPLESTPHEEPPLG
jgi:probable rRNA maturation factor